MLLEIVLFYAAASVATTMLALSPRLLRAGWITGLPAALIALAVTAFGVGTGVDDLTGTSVLAAFTALVVMAATARTRVWSVVAVQLLLCVCCASIAYLAYAAVQSAFQARSPLIIAGSFVLWLLELAALVLTVSYTFEILDVLGRRVRPPFSSQRLDHWPLVAIQVPTYNEPADVVRPTLEALARVDYPNVLVQVVDNNTSDPEIWQALERLCAELGPRFRFVHLDPWPGFKAGALNEATRRLPADVEIVGIVDADYVVEPDFLQTLVPYFGDPSVAFVQSAQHYRDWEDDRYLRGLFYSFRYFFDVSMPARDHRNAIIFCGTMGLIRRAALEQIGGWNEECVTEDAEASLRMLGSGNQMRGVYIPRPRGAGLMPLSFDGLKKQRYRWALGGIQILRQHWRELLPFASHRMRLTRAQRVHYLLGSVQWFGELLTAIFTILLLLTAIAIGLHRSLPVRQLTGSVLVIPLVFLATGVGRALWAMRRTTGCSYGDAVRAMRVWFALSWVVTLACVRGLLTSRADFLRTPKRKEGEATLRQALRASRPETALALAAVGGAVVMVVRAPQLATATLAVLLLFSAWLYSSAPWASAAAEGITLTPLRRSYLASSQNTGERPPWRKAGIAASGLVLAFAGVAAAVFILTSPSDSPPFSGQVDLPKLGSTLSNHGAPASAPSPAATPSSSPAATQSSTSSSSSSSGFSSSSSSTSSASSSTATSPAPAASPTH